MLLTPLMLAFDWDFVLLLEYTLGLFIVAAIASSPSDLPRPHLAQNLSALRSSPARIVVAKWSSAFRFALAFILIPIFAIFLATGPDLAHWQELLLLTGYMLAVSSAVTSLGIASFVWVRQGHHAVSLALILCVLVVTPLFAQVKPGPFDPVPSLAFVRDPVQAMEVFRLAAANPTRSSAAWLAGLSILVYLAAAIILFLLALAKCAWFTRHPGKVVTVQRPSIRQLTTVNGRLTTDKYQ